MAGQFPFRPRPQVQGNNQNNNNAPQQQRLEQHFCHCHRIAGFERRTIFVCQNDSRIFFHAKHFHFAVEFVKRLLILLSQVSTAIARGKRRFLSAIYKHFLISDSKNSSVFVEKFHQIRFFIQIFWQSAKFTPFKLLHFLKSYTNWKLRLDIFNKCVIMILTVGKSQ